MIKGEMVIFKTFETFPKIYDGGYMKWTAGMTSTKMTEFRRL